MLGRFIFIFSPIGCRFFFVYFVNFLRLYLICCHFLLFEFHGLRDTLIKDGTFSLPGKKALVEDDSIEVILVDVTECPIERPKKNKENGIPEKRNDIQ